jgi:hypothetical protein
MRNWLSAVFVIGVFTNTALCQSVGGGPRTTEDQQNEGGDDVAKSPSVAWTQPTRISEQTEASRVDGHRDVAGHEERGKPPATWKPLSIALGCTFAADAASTHYLLQNGGHEMVLTQNRYVNDAIIAGEAAGVTEGLLHLYRQHPRAATIVGWTIVGIRGAIVAHNVNQRHP